MLTVSETCPGKVRNNSTNNLNWTLPSPFFILMVSEMYILCMGVCFRLKTGLIF